jgi:hypothetical protein
MNSLIISEISNYYRQEPFYILDDYISINDDRFGRIVSFKLYEIDNEINVDFKESYKSTPYQSFNHITKKINSLEDFKKKWYIYYN